MDARFSARKASQLQKIPWRHGFYAQLDNGGAAGEQLAQRVLRGSALGLFRIENGVERRQNERGHEVSRGFFFELDAQIGNFFSQRVAIDAENLRGANLIAVGFLEREIDQRPFDPFDDERVEIVHVDAFGPAKIVFELMANDFFQRKLIDFQGRGRGFVLQREIFGKQDRP